VEILLTHVRRERVLEHRVKRPQHLVVTDQQVGLRAERVEHPGELDGDVPCSDDCDAFRLFLNVEETVRVDSVGCTWNVVVGRNGRSTTYGDGDLLRLDLVRLAVERLDRERVGVDKRCVALVVVDLIVDQVFLAIVSWFRKGLGSASGLWALAAQATHVTVGRSASR